MYGNETLINTEALFRMQEMLRDADRERRARSARGGRRVAGGPRYMRWPIASLILRIANRGSRSDHAARAGA